MPIVRTFGDVFLDEVLGLPPDREVEFSIYVILGSAPLSRALYQMAPLEFREFKEQLQTHLDREFIRASISL